MTPPRTGTTYRSGAGTALVGDRCALLLSRADDTIVGACWPLVAQGAEIGQIVEALARTGLTAVGDFALVRAHVPGGPDAVVLVRGSAMVTTVGSDAGRTVDGRTVTTWVETEVSAPAVRLELGSGGGGPILPLSTGVVFADAVELTWSAPLSEAAAPVTMPATVAGPAEPVVESAMPAEQAFPVVGPEEAAPVTGLDEAPSPDAGFGSRPGAIATGAGAGALVAGATAGAGMGAAMAAPEASAPVTSPEPFDIDLFPADPQVAGIAAAPEFPVDPAGYGPAYPESGYPEEPVAAEPAVPESSFGAPNAGGQTFVDADPPDLLAAPAGDVEPSQGGPEEPDGQPQPDEVAVPAFVADPDWPVQPGPDADPAAEESVPMTVADGPADTESLASTDGSDGSDGSDGAVGSGYAGFVPVAMVAAVQCPYGHLSTPQSPMCRICATPIAAQEPITVDRPALGLLRLSTGDVIPLDRDVRLGRNPVPADGASAEAAHLVPVPSPNKDISRTHVEVHLEDWSVYVTDLGSTNGTLVTVPGLAPVRLEPDQPMQMIPNTEVNLAGEVAFRFEVTA